MADEAQLPIEIFLAALVCGASVDAAARKAGIARRTAYRRMKDPKFIKRFQEARAEVTKRTSALLSAGSLEATKALMELISPKSPPPTRLGAAPAIIELGTKLREMVELEERLQGIEERMDANGSSRSGSTWNRNPGRN